MRKHYKLISTIVCLLLCVSMIAFGVYAARHVLVSLGSSVSFTPTNAKLKIFGDVYGCKENTNALSYYANNSGDGENVNVSEANDLATFTLWEFGNITFNDNYINENQDKPDSIYFFIQITNYVECGMKYTISLNKATTDTNLLLGYGYYSIKNDSADLKASNGFWVLNDATNSYKANSIGFEPSKLEDKTKVSASNAFTEPSPAEEGVALKSAEIIADTLSTTMLVIKVDVDDVDNNAEFSFQFTITASTVATTGN